MKPGFTTELNKHELHAALAGVEGWLNDNEAWRLHQEAAKVARRGGAPRIVEIGSWKGRSTIALALAIPAGAAARIFAIDPHTGSREHQLETVTVDTFADFRANLRHTGVEGFVVPLREPSVAARSHFDDHSVALLFVDGSHEYDDVSADISSWETALLEGATVAFNDPAWPGVNRALRERVCRRGSPYREPTVLDNTLFCHYRSRAPWTWRDQLAAISLTTFLAVRGWAAKHRRYVPARAIPPLRLLLNRIVR